MGAFTAGVVLLLTFQNAHALCQEDDEIFSHLNGWLNPRGYSPVMSHFEDWALRWKLGLERMRGNVPPELQPAVYNLSVPTLRTEFFEIIEVLEKLEKSWDTQLLDGCFHSSNFGIIFKVKNCMPKTSNYRAWTSLNVPERLAAYVKIGEQLVELDQAGVFFPWEEIPKIFVLNDAAGSVRFEHYVDIRRKTADNMFFLNNAERTLRAAYGAHLKAQFAIIVNGHEKHLKRAKKVEVHLALVAQKARVLIYKMNETSITLPEVLSELRILIQEMSTAQESLKPLNVYNSETSQETNSSSSKKVLKRRRHRSLPVTRKKPSYERYMS